MELNSRYDQNLSSRLDIFFSFLENIKTQEQICKGLKPVKVYDENKNLIEVCSNQNEIIELDWNITVEEIDSILSPFSLIAKTNILNLFSYLWTGEMYF